RDLPRRRRGGAEDDDRGGRVAGLQPPAHVPPHRAAARVPHQPARAQQQPRQPRQDDDARLCDRRAGAPLRHEPDLVRQPQRAGNDERAAARVLRAGRRAGARDGPLGARDPRAGVRRMRRAADRLWRGSAARTAVASRARAWHSLAPAATDLPVLLPAATRLARSAAKARRGGGPPLRLTPAHGVVLLAVFAIACGVAQAQAGAGQPSVLATLWKWLPVLLRGFVFNLAISAMAMSTGTLAGLVLGYAQISQVKAVRGVAAFVTHFFRNAPWLVLLFYCMFLLPFQVRVFGMTIPIPDWTKATFGLALPVMANVAEIVRGAVQSIPTAQWESAAS